MAEHVIYVIGEDTGPQKIGFSRSLTGRLRTLSFEHGKGIKAHFTATVSGADVYAIERLIHYHLRDKRIEGEWFDVTKEDAAHAITAGLAAFAAGERAPPQPTYTERMQLVVSPALLSRIDDWRRTAPGSLKGRSEAIRDLVDAALS